MNILDRAACNKLHAESNPCRFFEYLMALFAASFNHELSMFFWAFGLLLLPYNYASYITAIFIPLLTMLLVLGLKKAFARDRPAICRPRMDALKYNFRGKERSKSMPSGDSAQAAAFWCFLVLNGLIPWWIAVILTMFTMGARVYYLCHFPTDTIVGAAIGIIMTCSIDFGVKTWI